MGPVSCQKFIVTFIQEGATLMGKGHSKTAVIEFTVTATYLEGLQSSYLRFEATTPLSFLWLR
ncbi:hypothetical protein SERLA73DRAFT_191347 [Serpula lacrymans var. lacrymans S7.3]|uniref:Uncharacterized protein n=2 Tax=Serpula lacrymans var. lacrymans TaxID=341189 RepID=F8QHC2_SERL3|nr:uncharacterized protein SERLADRAFT_477646 [Serpula lacrymans var. lacrymans S7.9]EGN92305.1 hypothetical protein SERLA73DRAFT_191347 [Serpula lacrymans var. lacrymans S7.3]EGO20255.1 hypothetical protein SERLADRAFT_477646 [Serpula lacrymans var. lacrymans S7.9]